MSYSLTELNVGVFERLGLPGPHVYLCISLALTGPITDQVARSRSLIVLAAERRNGLQECRSIRSLIPNEKATACMAN